MLGEDLSIPFRRLLLETSSSAQFLPFNLNLSHFPLGSLTMGHQSSDKRSREALAPQTLSMGIEVYFGNLMFSTTNQKLHPHLSTYGTWRWLKKTLDGLPDEYGVEFAGNEQSGGGSTDHQCLLSTDLVGLIFVVNKGPHEKSRPIGEGTGIPGIPQDRQSVKLMRHSHGGSHFFQDVTPIYTGA
jgi:hypothetical protein